MNYNYFHGYRSQMEGAAATTQNATTSADNKYSNPVFEELAMPTQPDMIEMEQRQRIFEEVIISRIKVVQDFVKQRYGKLYKQMQDMKSNALVSGGSLREDQLLDKMQLDELAGKSHLSGAGGKGTIIEVVEEALKWRLEANNRKQ